MAALPKTSEKPDATTFANGVGQRWSIYPRNQTDLPGKKDPGSLMPKGPQFLTDIATNDPTSVIAEVHPKQSSQEAFTMTAGARKVRTLWSAK